MKTARIRREAEFYEKLEEGKVRCHLCPKNCLIRPGKAGFCYIRQNQDGTLVPVTYNRVSSAHLDPIEKKPLYHFHPGSTIFSVGALGCNLRCPWCQNWTIAQPREEFGTLAPDVAVARFTEELPAERALALMKEYKPYGNIGIAFTYNEPFIWLEYVKDVGQLAREHGFKNVLVTNGFVSEEPLRNVVALIDAMNIDVKGMSEEFYRFLGGRLGPVLRTAEIAKEAGCHIEITNLVIPTMNDADTDFEKLVDWIAESLGPDTPLHFSRYFPAFKFSAGATPLDTLRRAEEIARRRLEYVHLGNV